MPISKSNLQEEIQLLSGNNLLQSLMLFTQQRKEHLIRYLLLNLLCSLFYLVIILDVDISTFANKVFHNFKRFSFCSCNMQGSHLMERKTLPKLFRNQPRNLHIFGEYPIGPQIYCQALSGSNPLWSLKGDKTLQTVQNN